MRYDDVYAFTGKLSDTVKNCHFQNDERIVLDLLLKVLKLLCCRKIVVTLFGNTSNAR